MGLVCAVVRLCTEGLRSLCAELPKRKASTSLAPYDIELLEAWYDAVRGAHGMALSRPARRVVAD